MPFRVLYIDDDTDSLKAIEWLLRCVHYDVLLAQDVATGIQLAEDEQPHLILMNVHMPVISGLAATRYLKTQSTTRHIPIIAFTADVYSYAECMAAGCSAFLNKPVRRAELLYALHQWIQPSRAASVSV
jgi:CheY-like chemotaxis protein